MSTVIVRTNVGQLVDVLVRDLGLYIPSSGLSETFTGSEIRHLQESGDLAAYLTDNVYGAGSSTLILNDGTSDIAQADALSFLNSISNANLEMELQLAFSSSNLSNYKVLGFTGDNLTSIDIWTSPGMITKLYSKVLAYTGSRLDQVVTTRISDGAVLTRNITYVGDAVTSITSVLS